MPQRVNRCAERGLGVIQCYGSVNGEVKIGQNDTEFFNHGWDRILTDEDGAGRGIGRIMAGQNFSRGGAQGVWVRFPSATRWMPRAWLNTGAICGPKPATIWVPQTGDRCAERGLRVTSVWFGQAREQDFREKVVRELREWASQACLRWMPQAGRPVGFPSLPLDRCPKTMFSCENRDRGTR